MAWNLFHRDPHRVGPYEVLGRLGKGGAGSVFKARHGPTGAIVALKVLCREDAADPVLRKRFEQEFLACRTLDNPHIVRALDFGQDGNLFYMVMEYIDGLSLQQHLAKVGRLGEHEAVAVALQIAQALQHAHQRGMIHRDVKPGNILLSADGRARLTDFGLVKCLDSGLNLTETATVLGTPCFMAPEQLNDSKRIDHRCDIYALAASLYMALTGDVPFKTRAYSATVEKKLKGELAPPRQLVPTLSLRADWAIQRALSVSPVLRPASCTEFVRDLTGGELLVPATTSRPAPTGPPADERRRAVRYACNLEGLCSPLGAQTERPWDAAIRNVSVTGVALVLDRRFEPGTLLRVEWQPPTGDGPGSTMAVVVRAQPQEAGQWLLGCRLARPLGDDEVRGLI
jgi:serine/threonine protein kinase